MPGKSIPVLFVYVNSKKALIFIFLEVNFNGAIALLNISSNLTRKNWTKMYSIHAILFDVHREYLISQAVHLYQTLRIKKITIENCPDLLTRCSCCPHYLVLGSHSSPSLYS